MDSLFRTTDETPEKVEGKVQGQIPLWLSGSLYRNGPGKYEFGDTEYKHFFDGMALLHHFEINYGRVFYQSRYIRSESYNDNTRVNKIITSEFGTVAFPDPCKTIFQRMFAWFLPGKKTDNTLITVTPRGGHIYTSTETGALHKVNPDTLDTLERVDISGHLLADEATTHMLKDEDGSLHNLSKAYKGSYSFVKMPAPAGGEAIFENAELIGSIPFRWPRYPSYLHSFGMSENYYVMVEQSLAVSLLSLLTSTIRGKSFADCIQWYGKEKNLFHIVDKRTGKRLHRETQLISDPFFVFHHVNTYEEDGNLVVDVSAYEDDKIIKMFYLKNVRSEVREEYPHPSIRRYVLPLQVDQKGHSKENLVTLKGSQATAVRQDDGRILCNCETLLEEGFEFPQVNNEKRTKKHRYTYGAGGLYVHKLVKLDVGTKKTLTWEEAGVYTSEPIFVASPGATGEDDGVVLALLYEIRKPRHVTHLLVLDARTMTEVARVQFDLPMPRDLHGCFVNK